MARIFFFTTFSVSLRCERPPCILAAKETPTIVDFERAFNEEAQGMRKNGRQRGADR
jgi:hypothetical protein